MTKQEMEARRFEAREMLLAGEKQSAVAVILGVSRTAVSRWAKDTRAGADMRSRKGTGRPPKLSPEQMRSLCIVYESRPRWTGKTFAETIRQVMGVQYSPDHAWRISVRLGLRTVKARRPAAAVQELAIA